LLLTYSCKDLPSDSITDDDVYSILAVNYNAITNKTKGTAVFYRGSDTKTQIVFNEKAKLTFNESPLEKQTNNYYTNEIVGFYQTSTFKIIDVNNKQFVNTIGTYDISLPSVDTVVSSQAWTLIWNSNKTVLDSGEIVTVHIGEQQYTQDTVGAISILIAASEFLTKKGKTFTVYIERRKTQHLEQDLGGGGNIYVVYSSRSRNVFFK